ncbi:MAG: hypothetical protein KAS71_08635 [Bacteroidales bacterium]|nr:hypothetical protein [Bacteroidales bacterium]
MEKENIIKAFETLGLFLKQFSTVSFNANPEIKKLNDKFSDNFKDILRKTEINNPWFTEESIRISFYALSTMLSKGNIQNWLSKYSKIHKSGKAKNIGLVSAGNIPLVAFHDILSVLVTGHNLQIKLSSKDDILFPEIIKILIYLFEGFERKITIQDEKLENIEAVIATGSDNSSRYFQYYFGKYPNIIRSNRNSIAIITGNESSDQIKKLADDVFLYFGLGCRNVSKIYLPRSFDQTRILDNFEHYNHYSNHTKYANNYDYQRAILLVNKIPFLDNGFLIFREEKSLNSPVACLHYELYDNQEELNTLIDQEKSNIQCIVTESDLFNDKINFGKTQFPNLNDYADNMDSIEFLLNLYEK